MDPSRRAVLAGLAVTVLGAAVPARQRGAAAASEPARDLIQAARSQIGVTVDYDGSYRRIGYPGGDVPRETGVCTDVVVRAYRDGLGLDLQQLLHEDMRRGFSAYPVRWGLSRPDPNIDHRRVPNLAVFFRRHGQALTVPAEASGFEPGDLVTQLVGGRLPHIGIVSDRRAADRRRPLLIHNIGRGTEQSDMLLAFPITGRYRFGLDG